MKQILENQAEEGWIPKDTFKRKDLVPVYGYVLSGVRSMKETVHSIRAKAGAGRRSYGGILRLHSKNFIRVGIRNVEWAGIGCYNAGLLYLVYTAINAINNSS